ncbi:Uu.00g124510.m01.CDS01 [Anthostomella pinea]|uniref:Uu.00g124510.m01.CDS01 n=1 Tax=Anthostomella pinea TaxID=933095 RepID=A0AAI8YHR2_9PEZI|nr:Uu.00g124510.m01.CDS01 [Anthostomella pinea]
MSAINASELYLPGIIAIFSASLYYFLIQPAILSPLVKVPKAHWSCSISPAWILRARFDGRENRTLYEAHKQLGPIVRVGPNELSINNIEAVKTVYQGGFDKHQWYSVFDNFGVPCMFSSVQGKHHSARKRIVSHVYSKSYINTSASLAAQSDVILNSRLMPLLDSSTSESQIPHGLDVHSLFCAVAMDFISAYCFGIRRSTNFIQNKAYREHWLKLYTTRKGYGFFAQELPLLSKVANYLGVNLTPDWVTATNRELESWCKKLSDATVTALQKAENVTPNTADDPVVVRAILSGFEKEKANGPESPIYSTAILQPELSVASEVFDHVLAGQETTGVALTYLSHHLSQSLDLQRLLRTELLSLKPNLSLQQGKIATSDSKQLDNLPILHAMIMETVRRYAPAGGPEPRVTPSPSCNIGPYEVPGGTRVSASAYNIHRDENIYPDPEKWDHTRWLSAEAVDRSRKHVDKQFWGFSSGGRMCLGSNFVMHDMKLTIAAIYSNYTTHIVNDEGIEQTDAYTGHPKSNSLYIRFEKLA